MRREAANFRKQAISCVFSGGEMLTLPSNSVV
jgi:hypothetical protein